MFSSLFSVVRSNVNPGLVAYLAHRGCLSHETFEELRAAALQRQIDAGDWTARVSGGFLLVSYRTEMEFREVRVAPAVAPCNLSTVRERLQLMHLAYVAATEREKTTAA